MNKVYHGWLALVFLLVSTTGWTQSFTTILEKGVFRPVSEVSGEAKLTVSGNYLYFVGRDGNTGPELWRTDGTLGNTKLVKDITPGPQYGTSAPTSLFDLNGTLYFFAGPSLYKTDGSEAGTTLLRTFGDIGGANLLAYNGAVIFTINGGLWRTDGTPDGTVRIANRPATTPKVYNGIMYFWQSAGPTFQETDLFRSDGTLAGTSLIRQFPGSFQSFGVGVDGLYLTARTGDFHPTPGQWSSWKSDGTAAGTVQVGPTTTASLPGYFNVGDELYLRQNSASPQPTQRQNKTTGAFELVTPTPSLEVLRLGVLYNGQRYSNDYTPATGQELSRGDGSPVRDLNPGTGAGITIQPVVYNGLLYFTGNDGVTGFELYQSDGSAGGTRLTADFLPGTRGSYPLDLTVFNGALYFDTWDGTLYKLQENSTPPPTPTTDFAITGVSSLSCISISTTERQVTFSPVYSGLNGQAVLFGVYGELAPTADAGPYTVRLYTDNPVIKLEAIQAGVTTSYSYNWLSACNTSTSPTTTPPTPTTPATTDFTITSVTTATCEAITATERRITFTPVYSATTSDPISFRVVNEIDATTAPGPYSVRLYTDNPVVTLRAEQGGKVADFRYEWLKVCNPNGRLGVAEATSPLQVTVLGNPVVGESAQVEIRGAEGQSVAVQLVDLLGIRLHQQQIRQAAATERLSLPLGRSQGMLLLHVITPAQQQQLKLVRP